MEHVGEGFVELVERGILEGPEAEATVRHSLYPLLDAGADTIVLGCTHYPFLLHTLQKVAAEYPEASTPVRFIDPAPAVARHLVYVMVQERLLGERQATKALATVVAAEEARALGQALPQVPKPDIELIATGDPSGLQSLFNEVFREM